MENGELKSEERDNESKKKLRFKTKLLLTIAVIIVTGTLLLVSPLFSVKNINFSSDVNSELKNSILNLIGDVKGENGFLFVAGNVSGLKNIDYLLTMRAKNIEDSITFEMPELKNVKVKFEFPNTLNITFGKRVPAYIIDIAGSYVCADVEGFVLDIYIDTEGINLPVVKGVELTDYKIGQYITSDNEEQIKALKYIFNEIYKCDSSEDEFKLLSHIEIIDVSEYNKIWMFIEESRISVKLGDIDNIGYKISALKEILLTGETTGKQGTINCASTPIIFKEE